MTSFILSNIADGIVLLLLLGFARLGYRNGFAESIWPMLLWVLVAFGGALAWAPLGDQIHDRLGVARLAGYFLAYFLTGAVVAGVVLGLRRLYAAQLLLIIPLGRVDGFMGMGSGLVTGSALSLVILALLNPLGSGVEEIEWNPMDLQKTDAIASLFTAVVDTVHQVALQESTVGRFVAESFPGVLIANPNFSDPGLEPYPGELTLSAY